MKISPLYLFLFAAVVTASSYSTLSSVPIPYVNVSIPPEIITAAFTSAAASQALCLSNDVRNDVDNGLCNEVVIIYARGTFGSGNIGCDVGVAFVDAVSAAEPARVIVQGVPYNADILGYLNGGSEEGAKNMAALIEKAASQCPCAKIVLGGFSQGAQVTHKAVARIAATLSTKVVGIVLFGDPDNDQPFPGVPEKNVLTFCNLDDPICFGIPLPILGHQKYKKDVAKAAAWVAGKV